MRSSPGTVIPLGIRKNVHRRDQGCVADRAKFPPHVCDRFIEQDHVRASHGMGMKSRSSEDNLVELCGAAHRWKTENGRIARPKLLAYLERAEAVS